MSTSIQATLGRSVGYDSFKHITPLRPAAITGGGLLFDGELTDTQIGDLWWFVTSADDADQAKREAIALLVADAESGVNGASWLNDAFAELGRYVLGLADTA